MKLFDDIFRNKLERKNDLYDYLLAIFYTIGTRVLSKDKMTLFESLRKIVFTLVRDDESSYSKADEVNTALYDELNHPGEGLIYEFNSVEHLTLKYPKPENKV